MSAQEGGVTTMDASAAVPAATLDRYLLEEVLAAPPPACLLIFLASTAHSSSYSGRSPRSAGNRLDRPSSGCNQDAGEHLQQRG